MPLLYQNAFEIEERGPDDNRQSCQTEIWASVLLLGGPLFSPKGWRCKLKGCFEFFKKFFRSLSYYSHNWGTRWNKIPIVSR